ncbi:MAG: lamin tail domain-containing protein, partial [Candidatus Aenigmatarchaeota archaeon]
MQKCLILLFLLLITYIVSAIRINEIMYNPIEDDNYNEWIELYNPTNLSISLENWTICDIKLMKGYVNQNDGI